LIDPAGAFRARTSYRFQLTESLLIANAAVTAGSAGASTTIIATLLSNAIDGTTSLVGLIVAVLVDAIAAATGSAFLGNTGSDVDVRIVAIRTLWTNGRIAKCSIAISVNAAEHIYAITVLVNPVATDLGRADIDFAIGVVAICSRRTRWSDGELAIPIRVHARIEVDTSFRLESSLWSAFAAFRQHAFFPGRLIAGAAHCAGRKQEHQNKLHRDYRSHYFLVKFRAARTSAPAGWPHLPTINSCNSREIRFLL